MTFDKGTLILVDYTAKVKDTDQIFDTTIEADAKKHSIYDASTKYQPKLIAVGESWVLKGFDDALTKADVDQKLSIEVTPDKGFGERDPGKVRMIPLRKLGDDAEKITVGDVIDIDDKRATVRFIGSGRVQVDYNHRFAGKTIVYDANIVKLLKDDNDKAIGIFKRHIPIDDSKISIKRTENYLDIAIPQELFDAERLQSLKNILQREIFNFIPTLEKINYIETHVNKNPKKEITTEKSNL